MLSFRTSSFFSPNWLKGTVKRFYGLRFFGDFPNWESACEVSSGYEAEPILAQTFARTKEAITNPSFPPAVERIFEILRQVQPNRILDFGGGMGLYYFLLRDRLPGIKWDVVDLPATVEVARYFVTEHLHFYSDLADVPKPDVVIASGSLQYCEHPLDVLKQLLSFNVPLIIERIPVLDRTRLVVQIVTKPYRASYPVWVLSRKHFAGFPEWKGDETVWLDGQPVRYSGFLLTAGPSS